MAAESELDQFYSELEKRCLIAQPRRELVLDIGQNEILMDARDGAFLTFEKKDAEKIIRVYQDSEEPISKIIAPRSYGAWPLFDGENILHIKNGASNMEWFRLITYSLEGKVVEEIKFDEFSLDKDLCPGFKNTECELGEPLKYHYVSGGWSDVKISREGIIYILALKSQTGSVGILALDRKRKRYNQGLLVGRGASIAKMGIHNDDIFLLINKGIYKTDGSFEKLEEQKELSKIRFNYLWVGPGPKFFTGQAGPDMGARGYLGVFNQEGKLITFLEREQIYIGVVPVGKDVIYAKAAITQDDGLDMLARTFAGMDVPYKAQIHKFRFAE